MAFALDKNIPLPRARQKYPFRVMQVGDSVFVPDRAGSDLYGCFPDGKTFRTRKEEKAGVVGVRVWRVT